MTTAASLLAGFSYAGFPAQPQGTTVLDSRFNDGVQISYKEVTYFIARALKASVG